MTSTHYFKGRPFEVTDIGGGMVRIARETTSGDEYSVTVSWEQVRRWQGGGLIQDVMPELSADEREFLITGFSPEDRRELFGEDPE